MTPQDATEEEELVTRIDAAREAAGKTREQLVPYAASARDAAVHYTDEAWLRLAPHIETIEHSVIPRVVPLWEQARANVPPAALEAAGRAAERTVEAAKAAGLSAKAAAVQARQVAVPAVGSALEEAVQATATAAATARDRGAAALPVLRGQISVAEIEALTAQHAHKGRWTRRFVAVGVIGAVAGGGVAAWKWWQKQSNPDWLVEPPAAPLPLRSTPETSPAAGASGSSATGALTPDPGVAAKESEAETLDPDDPVDLEAPLDGEDEDGPTS